MSKRGTIPITEVQENLFVRTHLNVDHAQYLATLLEAGQRLPPIRITPSKILIDGRHRLHAHRLLNRQAVEVEYSDQEPETGDLISDALLSNVGGALPPTHSDIIHAVKQMIDSGMQNSVITKQLQKKWPTAVVRRYVSDAHGALHAERIQAAIRDVVDNGKTVAEAALEHKVKPDAVKAAMTGKRRRKATTAELKATLSTIFKSRGQQMGHLIKKAVTAYEDGQLSAKQLEDVLHHAAKLCNYTRISVRDWNKRLKLNDYREDDVA
jgi:hypothetical protein